MQGLTFLLVIFFLSLTIAETESILPLGIKFTPPSNRVLLGQPLVVRCELTPTESGNSAGSVPDVSMFLYCPIAPWSSYCFQNCQSACVGNPSGECPFDNDLGGITCNTIVTQSGQVIYEYLIPEVTSSWMPSASGRGSKAPGFYCKLAGSRTREVWLSQEKVRTPSVPVEASTLPPKRIEEQVAITPAVEKPKEATLAKTRNVESPSNGNAILHELFVIGSIIVVCLSILLNVICCIRCVLIRQYSKSKRPARMQHTFCMAYEIEFGRRLHGIAPHKKEGPFNSLGDANSLMLPNPHHPGSTHNGSEFHQPIGLYSPMNAFSDNISNTTGGEAPSSVIRGYPGPSGSVFSVPPGAICQLVQPNPPADKQSNAASSVTVPLYQPAYQPQVPVAMATLERARYVQPYHHHQPTQDGNPGEMLVLVSPNGQPITLVPGVPGVRTSLLVDNTQNVPDVVSLTSHNTTELPVTAVVTMPNQRSQVVSHHSSLDHAQGGASQWSDSGNWSGGSGGAPQGAQGVQGQPIGINGICEGETGQKRELLNGLDKNSDEHNQWTSSADTRSCLQRLPHHQQQQQLLNNNNHNQQQHGQKRTTGQVRRLNHYRRRSGAGAGAGVQARTSPSRARDLDATTEDDASDWSTSVYGEEIGQVANGGLEIQYSVC